MAAEGGRVNSPALLFWDDRKILGKTGVGVLDGDRVVFAAVVESDGLWAAQCLVCLAVEVVRDLRLIVTRGSANWPKRAAGPP